MRKNFKKVLSMSLSVIISMSCFIAPAFAATSQTTLADEYAELKNAPAISTYTMATGNKTMLDLTDSKALPSADDWWSNRIREASNVAYLNLEEASPEMRAIILTARYEIASSKNWAADVSFAGTSDISLFYELFPASWTVPRVNTAGYLFDEVSEMFVAPAYLPNVYDAPDYAGLEAESRSTTANIATAPFVDSELSSSIEATAAYGVFYQGTTSFSYNFSLLYGNKMTFAYMSYLWVWVNSVNMGGFPGFAIQSVDNLTGKVFYCQNIVDPYEQYVFFEADGISRNLNIFVRSLSSPFTANITLLEE